MARKNNAERHEKMPMKRYCLTRVQVIYCARACSPLVCEFCSFWAASPRKGAAKYAGPGLCSKWVGTDKGLVQSNAVTNAVLNNNIHSWRSDLMSTLSSIAWFRPLYTLAQLYAVFAFHPDSVQSRKTKQVRLEQANKVKWAYDN